MAEQSDKQQKKQSISPSASDSKQQKTPQPGFVPKTESSSEAEGANDQKPTGNQAVEEKVESSSESGQ